MVVARSEDERIEPGELVMLEGLGACLVLRAADSAGPEPLLQPGERATTLDVEALAFGNTAPDLP